MPRKKEEKGLIPSNKNDNQQKAIIPSEKEQKNPKTLYKSVANLIKIA